MSKVSEQRREVRAKLGEAESRIGELEAELAAAQAASGAADELRAQLEAWQAKEATWQTERALLAAGVTDDEGLGVVSLLWQRTPEDQRPEGGVSAWLQDRETLPRAVRAYLPDDAQQASAPQQPTANAGARSYTGAPSQYASGSVSQMSDAEYRAKREAVWTSLGIAAPSLPATKG